MRFESEVHLAEKVISWLELQEWDVYQEVFGIDIVAVKGKQYLGD